KTPPGRRGVNPSVAAGEPVLRIAEDERRAAHRLDAPGDIEVTLAGGNRVTGRDDRGEAGGAKPVDGHTRDRIRQPGKQRGHPGDIAVVLARLVRAAEVDLPGLGRFDAGAADVLADH